MTREDDTLAVGPREPSAQDELAIRKAMAAVNDLEPPRDDLFVDRAISRGRARANRSGRPLLIAAAAAGVIAVGGYAVTQFLGNSTSTSAPAAGAPERNADAAAQAPGATLGTGAGMSASTGAAAGAEKPTAIPSLTSLPTTATGQLTTEERINTGPEVFLVPFDGPPDLRTRVDPALSLLLETYQNIFAGAWSNQDGSVTIALTTLDPAAQAQVRSLTDPSVPVGFTTGKRTLMAQSALAQRVLSERSLWAARGIELTGVSNDPRTQQVVVSSAPPIAQRDLDAAYGPGATRAG